MKNWLLNKKLDSLAEVIDEVSVRGSTKIDPNCFTEGEKRLFQKNMEAHVLAKYHPSLSVCFKHYPRQTN